MTRNNGFFTRLDKKLVRLDPGSTVLKDSWHLGVDQGFSEPSTVFEIVEVVMNLQAVYQMIRPFEYGPTAFLRAMHKYR